MRLQHTTFNKTGNEAWTSQIVSNLHDLTPEFPALLWCERSTHAVQITLHIVNMTFSSMVTRNATLTQFPARPVLTTLDNTLQCAVLLSHNGQ